MSTTGKIALIVDPDEATAIALARQLARLGLDSLTASGVETALDTLGWLDPDIVLVSQIADREDGVRRISRTGEGRRPLVFVSDGGDAGAIGAAIWQGASECLMQPFDEEILEFKLQQTGVL
jgi:two-component system chemotaxis response regulator CheY